MIDDPRYTLLFIALRVKSKQIEPATEGLGLALSSETAVFSYPPELSLTKNAAITFDLEELLKERRLGHLPEAQVD